MNLEEIYLIEEEEAIFNTAMEVCAEVYPDWAQSEERLCLMRPQTDRDRVIIVISRPDHPRLFETLEEALPGYDLAPHRSGPDEVAFSLTAWYWRVGVGLEEERAGVRPQSEPIVPVWRKWLADGLIIGGAWLVVQIERWAVRLDPTLAEGDPAMDEPDDFGLDNDDDAPPAAGYVGWKS